MTHTSSMATPEAGALAKTREEVEELKRQWFIDPCWDIEYTEGFEKHREELYAYRKAVELQNLRRWEKQEEQDQPVVNVLTLRDHFAICILNGFCANPQWNTLGGDKLAQAAYEQADFMLAARRANQ